MNKSAFFSILFFSLIGYSQNNRQILDKTVANLKSIKRIEYNYSFCQNYQGFEDTQNSFCFYDFTSTDTIIGAKYHFVEKYGEEVFNGSQAFSLRNDSKTVVYSDQPNRQSVSHRFYSIYVLRKLLPELITDTSIKIARQNDTLLNANDCYKFRISIVGKSIDHKGKLVAGQPGNVYDYFLTISKKDYLPVQVQYMFQKNDGSITTTFEHINIDAARNDSIWSYERFPKSYRRLSTWEAYNESIKPKREIVVLNKQTQDWTLPLVGGDSVNISKLKGNLVLLDFWFVGCVPCAEAVPFVNELVAKYGKMGLKVYGIEFMKNNVSGLLAYIKKNKMQYQNLYNGVKVFNDYGLKAAPGYILIDRAGKVVYINTGTNKEELMKVVGDYI